MRGRRPRRGDRRLVGLPSCSPEGFFAHYLMMVGAIGGRSCVAAGEMYSAYESAGGTGQAHVWFERPAAGWTADLIWRPSDQRDHQRRLSQVVRDHDRHRHPRSWATNCRHPRIVSDARNSSAPAIAHMSPAAAAEATISEITPRYDATGIRNAGRRSTAPARMRRPSVTPRGIKTIHIARSTTIPLVGDHEPDHVRDVSGQERGQPAHEPRLVAEQEHVTGEAQHERDDEPRRAPWDRPGRGRPRRRSAPRA